jgi:subfamily B ATP-binding cassette protein MsbA
MKPIIRILSYLKHFPWHLGINVFFNLLHIVFNLGSYVMIVPFVELLFGLSNVPEAEPAFSMSQEGLTEWAFWHLHQYSDALGLWRCLVIIAGGYLAFSLLSNLFRYLALFFLDAVRNGLIEHLRNDLYHRITILPVSYFNKQRRGDLISRMSNDLADIEWSIVSTLQMLVISPINIIVFSATFPTMKHKIITFKVILLKFPISIFFRTMWASKLQLCVICVKSSFRFT